MDIHDYHETKINEFHENMKENVTGNKLVLNLFDTKIVIDRGVIEHVRNLRHMYHDKDNNSDFPLTNLDGRPANIACSPMGVISKDTGVPEFTGFYNRDGGGFLTDSFLKATEKYIDTRDENHPCVILTPKDYQIDIGDCRNVANYFKFADADICVVLTAGHHFNNSQYGVLREGKVVIVGNPQKTGSKRKLYTRAGPMSKGVFGFGKRIEYYNHTVNEYDEITGEACFVDMDGNVLQQRRVSLYEKEVNVEKFLNSGLDEAAFIRQYGPFDR